MQTSSTRNNAVHYLTFIKMLLTRCLGMDSFLIRYPEVHTKQTCRQLQKFLDYL